MKNKIIKSGSSIYISNENLEECLYYIKDHSIKNIIVSDQYYTGDNLDFLLQCKKIETIGIDAGLLKNIDGIYNLDNLKELSMIENDNKIPIQLEQFPHLEILRLEWIPKMRGLSSLKSLERLELYGYKPEKKNLTELSDLRQLKQLVLTQGNISSLHGIGNLINLRELQLNYIRALKDVKDIKSLKYIRKLEIESCKNIRNISECRYLNNLETLDLFKCGDIETIDFVQNMENLSEFFFKETNIIDGNLNACKNIKSVSFTNKKHYSHKEKDFEVIS
ncbi:MAG: leucine-rich repeat domain-containing protein [Bacillus sp. (in: firmicutes)]